MTRDQFNQRLQNKRYFFAHWKEEFLALAPTISPNELFSLFENTMWSVGITQNEAGTYTSQAITMLYGLLPSKHGDGRTHTGIDVEIKSSRSFKPETETEYQLVNIRENRSIDAYLFFLYQGWVFPQQCVWLWFTASELYDFATVHKCFRVTNGTKTAQRNNTINSKRMSLFPYANPLTKAGRLWRSMLEHAITPEELRLKVS